MPHCPFLTDCAERLQAAGGEFEDLVVEMRPDQALWRPAPKAWSVAECVDHVSVAARLYFGRIRPAIERARERGIVGAAPYRQRTLLGRMVLRVLEPGAGRRFPAPGVFRPSREEIDFASVRNEFRAALAVLGDLMEEADGLDLGRIRFVSPAGPILKVTLAEAFEIQALHIPRHLAQARAVTRAEGYPA